MSQRSENGPFDGLEEVSVGVVAIMLSTYIKCEKHKRADDSHEKNLLANKQ